MNTSLALEAPRSRNVGFTPCAELHAMFAVLCCREAMLLEAIAQQRPLVDVRAAFAARVGPYAWPRLRGRAGSGGPLWMSRGIVRSRTPCGCRQPVRPACCSGCRSRRPTGDIAALAAMHQGLVMKKSLLLVLLAACSDPPDPPPAVEGYPQLPTVTIDQLKQVLPRDANGDSVLLEVGGLPLTLGAPRRDAIGAAAKCSDLVSSCVAVTKDLDACVAKLPICKTEQPWEEALPCCAEACVKAYQEERRLGAAPLDANDAVFGSDHECFPGRQELLRAAGGTPFLGPRRAPR